MGRSVVAAGVLAVLAYVAQMIVGLGMPVWAFWTTTSLGALATLTTVLLANRRVATAAQAAEAATANQRRAFEDALVPLALNLQQTVSTRNRAQRSLLQHQAKVAIVTLAARLMGTEHARACFLELADPTPGQRELRCLNNLWSGGTVPPRTVFREADALGREVLKQLDDGASAFVEDVADLPSHLQPESDRYRTYISCPVKAGETSFGVLTVDCPVPGDLTREDVTMVDVFARMLSVALADRR